MSGLPSSYEESTRAVRSRDIREKLKGGDMTVIALSSTDSVAWLRAARQKWTAVVKQRNIGVD